MRYSVPFAEGSLAFDLPAGMRGTVVTSRPTPPLEAWRAIHGAIRQPLGTPPLAELAGPGDRVCIAVTDATRACPDRLIVGPICTQLEMAGVAKEDILILVATGLHRDSTPAEKEEKLGTEIVQRYKVIDHDARDPAWLTDVRTVGLTSGASVPEDLVQGVLAHLADFGYAEVSEYVAATETLTFSLPKELRKELRGSGS